MTAHRVVLRHIGDERHWAEWHGDMTWTYAQAHDVLVGLERLFPRLHNPGVKFYLSAGPIPREEHMAAVVSALLEA